MVTVLDILTICSNDGVCADDESFMKFYLSLLCAPSPIVPILRGFWPVRALPLAQNPAPAG